MNIRKANTGDLAEALRIYAAAREYMSAHYPATGKHYLVADICRPELLVEIEGLAHI